MKNLTPFVEKQYPAAVVTDKQLHAYYLHMFRTAFRMAARSSSNRPRLLRKASDFMARANELVLS